LAIARKRFRNLCCGGILPSKEMGTRVDIDDIDVALVFLLQCRPTVLPNFHSFDLRRAINVQLGAVIAAATALGFGVHSWPDITCYAPHAMIAVRANDVRRVAYRSLPLVKVVR
jgi:hypothetical protein